MSVMLDMEVLEKVCSEDVERERTVPLVSAIVLAESFWMVCGTFVEVDGGAMVRE
jgi:hypothetical protein